MAAKKGFSSRSEIQEKIQEDGEQMNEGLDELDTKATDIEIVRETLDSLDMEGFSAEGAEDAVESIDNAEDKTIDLFEKDDQDLEEVMDKSREYTDQLNDNQNTGRDDLARVSDATGRIETAETADELSHTKGSMMEDLDFLEQQEKEGIEYQQETEQTRKEYHNRVNSTRRS